jgi:hypothetical protein
MMHLISKAGNWQDQLLTVATPDVSRRIQEINIEGDRFTLLMNRANKNDCISFARKHRNHLPSEKKSDVLD